MENSIKLLDFETIDQMLQIHGPCSLFVFIFVFLTDDVEPSPQITRASA